MEPALLKIATLPLDATGRVMVFARVTPAVTLRLETLGRDTSEGYAVRYVDADGETLVKVMVTAETPTAGRPLRPATCRTIVAPAPIRCEPPVPLRVSSRRVGTTGKKRPSLLASATARETSLTVGAVAACAGPESTPMDATTATMRVEDAMRRRCMIILGVDCPSRHRATPAAGSGARVPRCPTLHSQTEGWLSGQGSWPPEPPLRPGGWVRRRARAPERPARPGWPAPGSRRRRAVTAAPRSGRRGSPGAADRR